MLKRARPAVVWTVLVALGGVLGACESAGSNPTATDRAAQNERPQPIRLTDVPPPPGLDAGAVGPLDGDALARAQRSADQVIASLPNPRVLERAARNQATPPPRYRSPAAGGAEVLRRRPPGPA
ncbi:MAG: hypothetical protein AAFX76_05030 [Planctomycetota bacterium]